MNGKWVIVLAAVMSLTGCIAPGGEAEDFDMAPTFYRFIFPDRASPAELVVSEVDQDGLRLEERVSPLWSVVGDQMEGAFRADYLIPTSGSADEYCLVEDILIRDIATTETKGGVPAGTCFRDGPWVHPDVEE